MSRQNGQRTLHAVLAGALTSSAGVFLAKTLSFFYVIPFNALAGTENLTFYAAAYSWYTALLQIALAGIPFAAAALAAGYAEKNDIRTVLLIRKLTASILTVSGFLLAVLFVLLARPLGALILGASAPAADLESLRITVIILALALFLVPILHSYRGFYLGLQEHNAYAYTRQLERVLRLLGIVILGWIAVDRLHLGRISAVYAAAASSVLAAAAALFFYVRLDHRNYGILARAARQQEEPAVQPQPVLKELFFRGLPYFLSALLGTLPMLINATFLIRALTGSGSSYADAKVLYAVVQFQTERFTALPQALAVFLCAGLMPLLNTAAEEHSRYTVQKNVLDALERTLYLVLPLCVYLLVLAGPLYEVMYGGSYLAYGEEAMWAESFQALALALSAVTTLLMLTINLRRQSLFYLLTGVILKAVFFGPLIRLCGFSGAIISTTLAAAVIVYLDLAKIRNRFEVNYTRTVRRMFRMLLACLAMNGGFFLLRLAGLHPAAVSRPLGALELAAYAAAGFLLYYYITSLMNVPQGIFRMDLKQLLKQWLPHRHEEDA